MVKAPAKFPQKTKPQLRNIPLTVQPGLLSITAKGTRVNTPVNKSYFNKYSIIKPTGKSTEPKIGLPVLVITVIAKKAAKAKIAPAINARINVSLVDMNIFCSPASTIFLANSDGSK